MTNALRGSCLCGEIRFEIDGKIGAAGQCHCSKCRKVSGTDGNAVFYASTAGFRWLAGEDLIERFVVPDGRGWTSHFCRRCGSPAQLSDADRSEENKAELQSRIRHSKAGFSFKKQEYTYTRIQYT